MQASLWLFTGRCTTGQRLKQFVDKLYFFALYCIDCQGKYATEFKKFHHRFNRRFWEEFNSDFLVFIFDISF